MVENHANGRLNWLIGAGEAKATRVLPKLYRRGFTGPLWKYNSIKRTLCVIIEQEVAILESG